MDVSHILDHLNDQQRDAVTSEKKHLMVLAGAGSGKTRVLVHKIAWEVEALNRNPASIMAVTFTNKAALEMRSRIEELLQAPMMDGWVGTFHGLAHKMLKRFHKEARRQNNQKELSAMTLVIIYLKAKIIGDQASSASKRIKLYANSSEGGD